MKYICHVINKETGFISDEEIIEATDAGEAERIYYANHADCGFEGDKCIVLEYTE